jgi:hypothetical protein
MAQYELKDEEQWLPTFAKGKGRKCSKIRVPKKDGSWDEFHISVGHRTVTVTDDRSIRVLDADPKFTRIA